MTIRTIYSLSITEQEVLKKFINKNLNIRFIYLMSFLYKISILFVKKKDSSFCLCVNFQGLNHIIWKYKYLLSLISNFLNFSWKIYIYTKINLYYIYYLVQVIEGDKWKMAFYTHYRFFEWAVGLTNALIAF